MLFVKFTAGTLPCDTALGVKKQVDQAIRAQDVGYCDSTLLIRDGLSTGLVLSFSKDLFETATTLRTVHDAIDVALAAISGTPATQTRILRMLPGVISAGSKVAGDKIVEKEVAAPSDEDFIVHFVDLNKASALVSEPSPGILQVDVVDDSYVRMAANPGIFYGNDLIPMRFKGKVEISEDPPGMFTHFNIMEIGPFSVGVFKRAMKVGGRDEIFLCGGLVLKQEKGPSVQILDLTDILSRQAYETIHELFVQIGSIDNESEIFPINIEWGIIFIPDSPNIRIIGTSTLTDSTGTPITYSDSFDVVVPLEALRFPTQNLPIIMTTQTNEGTSTHTGKFTIEELTFAEAPDTFRQPGFSSFC